MNETNRYTIKSYNKHYNMSLSKARLEEVNPGKKFRVKTSYAFWMNDFYAYTQNKK